MKGHDTSECLRPTAQMLAETHPIERLPTKPSNVRFIDMSEYLCHRESCPPVIGNIFVYRDDSHITAACGAHALAPVGAAIGGRASAWVDMMVQPMLRADDFFPNGDHQVS